MASFWESARSLFGRKDGAVRNSLELFREIYGGRTAKSGVAITAARALEFSTVLACVRAIANGVAQVPVGVYRAEPGRRVELREHPLADLISATPARGSSAFEFFETLVFHLVLAGNAYAFLNRVGSDRTIREMVLIEPHRVTVVKRPETLVYRVAGDGGVVQEFPAESIWHVRGPSWNGWSGLEGVQMAREAIGLGIALEQDQAQFHANGARTSGMLAVEGIMNAERYQQLSAWLDKYLPGGERHQKPMLLDNGARYTPFRMTAVDSQSVEQRRFQIEDVCRAFGVLPIVIGHADKTGTYASSEQMFLAHVVHTMLPWYVRIEKSAAVHLLTPKERSEGIYFKFTAAALLRGAIRDQGEYFKAALGAGGGHGWLTPNEIRQLLEFDRINDPDADRLPTPPVNAPGSN